MRAEKWRSGRQLSFGHDRNLGSIRRETDEGGVKVKLGVIETEVN